MQRFTSLVLLVFGVLAVLPAQEAPWYEGKPVAEIRFEGLSAVSENELLGLIRPYIGRLYTDDLSWEIQGKLYALDYFDLIIPEKIPSDAENSAVILVLEMQETPVVDNILFVGNGKIRRGELLDAVLVKAGDPLNPSTLSLDEQAIIDLYLEKGFIDAQVSSDYEVDEENNQVVITFSIQEGNQTKISEIRFSGNDEHVSDSTLRNLMTTKAQSLFSKGLFVETKLQEDLKAIERYYGDQGFIDMKILEVDKSVEFDEKEELRKMVITIYIDEGDEWLYGGMTFSGNRIYSTEELEEVVQQIPGKTFSSTKFQVDYQKVTDLYFENGYIFNNFTYEEIRDEEAKTISFAVSVVERERAHIENIIIRGNSKTKSYVIRREIPLEEGEVFSKAKILEGVMNLYNLQYFDVVEPNPSQGSQDGLMDLIVDVAEGKTSDISFGLSFSGGPDFPVSGQVKWNDRNFLGRGQVLGVEGNVSPDVQSLVLRFTEPRILGLRWSGGASFSYSHRKNRYINQDWDGNGLPDPYLTWQAYDKAGRIVPTDYQMEYMSHNIGGSLNTGYGWVTGLGRLSISTGLNVNWEFVKYDDTVYRPQNQDIRENLGTWKYDDSVTLRLAWDTTDVSFEPTKGFLLSENLTFAGLLPVSRRDYIKSITRFNYNLKLFDIPVNDEGGSFKSILYLNSAFHGLFDKPWSDVTADRQRDGFYVDGMFLGRGWDPTSGFRYLWDNTIQLKFPLVPNILAFDIFMDAVGAWVATDGEFSTSNALLNMHVSDWRFSLGAGFRFANPQFPIGLYLVKKFKWDSDGTINWNPEPDKAEFKKWGLDLVIAFNFSIY